MSVLDISIVVLIFIGFVAIITSYIARRRRYATTTLFTIGTIYLAIALWLIRSTYGSVPYQWLPYTLLAFGFSAIFAGFSRAIGYPTATYER